MAEEKNEQTTGQDKRKLGIREKLSEIQTKMNVPKDKHSDYGGYDYRSAESILNEFKKYAREYNASLLLRDEIVEIAGRVYVKSIAIDGAVYEAKELGIETMTPNQIKEMMERWGVKVGKET